MSREDTAVEAVCTIFPKEGVLGSQNVPVDELSSAFDRWRVRSIIFSLASELDAKKSAFWNTTCTEDLCTVAKQLRVSCKSIKVHSDSTVRLLPFADIIRVRDRLCSIRGSKFVRKDASIDRRTVAKTEAVLAATGIILKKPSARLRVYIGVIDVENLLSGMIASHEGVTTNNWIRPSFTEI